MSGVGVFQSKAKAEKNQAMEHQMSDNACRLCAVEKLTFEPPPIYCTACGARIKRNAPYYTTGSGDTRHYFCIPCYNEVRTENVEMEGMTYPKARLEKRKNDEETEEAVCIFYPLHVFLVGEEVLPSVQSAILTQVKHQSLPQSLLAMTLGVLSISCFHCYTLIVFYAACLCSGYNVISATCGNIKFVLSSMVGAMKVIASIYVLNVVV